VRNRDGDVTTFAHGWPRATRCQDLRRGTRTAQLPPASCGVRVEAEENYGRAQVNCASKRIEITIGA
jgi:hypothetical protein